MFELHTIQFHQIQDLETLSSRRTVNLKISFENIPFLCPFTFYLNHTNISLEIFLCSVGESNMNRWVIETMLYYNILSGNKKSQRKKWDRINLPARLFFMYKL